MTRDRSPGCRRDGRHLPGTRGPGTPAAACGWLTGCASCRRRSRRTSLPPRSRTSRRGGRDEFHHGHRQRPWASPPRPRLPRAAATAGARSPAGCRTTPGSGETRNPGDPPRNPSAEAPKCAARRGRSGTPGSASSATRAWMSSPQARKSASNAAPQPGMRSSAARRGRRRDHPPHGHHPGSGSAAASPTTPRANYVIIGDGERNAPPSRHAGPRGRPPRADRRAVPRPRRRVQGHPPGRREAQANSRAIDAWKREHRAGIEEAKTWPRYTHRPRAGESTGAGRVRPRVRCPSRVACRPWGGPVRRSPRPPCDWQGGAARRPPRRGPPRSPAPGWTRDSRSSA